MTAFLSCEPIDYVEGRDDAGADLFSLKFEGFRKLTGPGVYVALCGSGEGLQVLYIGSAKNVLARISESRHDSLSKAFENKDCRLIIRICKSERHARDFESQLIAEFNPILNIAGKPRPLG